MAGTAFGPPAFGWILNLIVRKKEALNSSGADWMLVLLVFDLTVVIDTPTFAKYIAYPEWQEYAKYYFVFVLVLGLVAWGVTINLIEPKLKKDCIAISDRVKRGLAYTAGWFVSIVMLATNIMFFIYEPK